MKKLITICDYCGKEIEKIYTLLPVRISEDEGSYKMKPDYEPYDMCLDCIKANLMMIKPGPLQKKQQAAGADPEEAEATAPVPAELEAQQEQQAEEQATPDADPEQQAEETEQKVKKTSAPKKKVDHGRIVALYTANPPRSIEWIADDCRCSQQTVINHLKKEGLYKTLQEQKEEKQEEEE